MTTLRRTLETAARWSRDWRVRVLVPIVLINLAAFAGLYTLMERYAMSNLMNTQQFGATLLLDELELDFREAGVIHGREALQARVEQHAASRGLLAVNVYDTRGRAIASSRGTPSPAETEQARAAIARATQLPIWSSGSDAGDTMFGVRALRKTRVCSGCHTGSAPALGAIQLGLDVSGPIVAARERVRRNFVMAGGAWLGLLALMFWAGGVVIGRPLAAMEKSIKAAAPPDALKAERRHDLDALAHRVHDTLWGLIQHQQQRDADIAAHMARAEQLAALGQLAAGLTHEIKNPLAGIAAALELLRDECARDDGERHLRDASRDTRDGSRSMRDEGRTIRDESRSIYDQMLAELRRVSATVDGLLRLAKPQPPQRARVDLTRLVREVTSLFDARLRRQGVRLEIEIPDRVPTLPLDSGLMVQLLINLLTNSMQATERGGSIRLLIAPFPRYDGVVLAVSDSGRGIAPDHLERIFDPFFTTKEEGTGLGLPICRQIVEQHGGTMDIESEPGKGTRVVVLLPDAEAAQEIESYGAVAAG